MSVPNFDIPLGLRYLEEPGPSGLLGLRDDLSVSEITSRLTEASKAESNEGAEFIAEYFSTFYYLCKKINEVPNHVKERGYKTLFRSFKKISVSLDGTLDNNLDPELQQKLCNIVKMLSYLLIEIAKRLQDYQCELASSEAKTKGKKPVKNEAFMDWVEEKNQMINEIYTFLQRPLKLLWDPPVVDEEFINLFANFCYKCLEDPSITASSMKPFRSSIFQVLATLTLKYHHGLSFCVKVVQLLRMNEHLVTPLAQGIVEMVNDGCGNVVQGIVREMVEADEQLQSDAPSARYLGNFLSMVAEGAPSALSPAVDLLNLFLSRDPPALRCCALTGIGEVVKAQFTKEDLEDEHRATRDSYLDTLEEHIHDTNVYVRSRALSVWQSLSLAKAIPVARLHHLLDLVIGRLGDRSSNVKKQAVQLIKVLLEGNPYSGQLDVKELTKLLEIEKADLQKLVDSASYGEWPIIEEGLKLAFNQQQTEPIESEISFEGQSADNIVQFLLTAMKEKNFKNVVAVFNENKEQLYNEMGVDDDDLLATSLKFLSNIWEADTEDLSEESVDKISTYKRRVEYLDGALKFAKQIDRAVPLILTLLDSSASMDVLEAISFFTAAFQFGFSKATEGVRRMLDLVFSKEAGIKKAVCNAYEQLHFPSTSERKQSIEAVRNLSELVVQLNTCQMDALEEIIRDWVQNGVIDKSCIQVMFERFSMKISGTTESQSWAALVLISMVGAEQPKVIRTNSAVIVNEGLGPRGARNPILAQYSCRALRRLAADGHKLPKDDDILLRLRRLLREGLWSSSNRYFIPFADEAISLVFLLAERPDAFAEELIVDLFIGIQSGKQPVIKQPRGRVLNANAQNEDLFGSQEEVEKSVEESVEADMSTEGVLIRVTRFVSILGTIASHYVEFLENNMLGELKRRNLDEYERKVKRQDTGKHGDASMIDREELEFARTAADDMNTAQMTKIAEECIVSGNGLLAKFLPLVQKICKNPGKYPYLPLQNAALITLGMFMQVSSKVCDENLQLLVTVTEKSQSPEKRRNGLVALWALQYRFPNTLEPWTSHMFALLKDSDQKVRRTAVQIVTHLIVNEMVKARTHLSDLATCIIDDDVVIAQTTRQFFREFAQKGNALFNVLPTLVSSLTNPSLSLEEESFQTIMRFILNLVTKDKQNEQLVEKLCQSFESSTTDRQCRDLAFCLAQLQYSEKALKKVLENFRCFGNKLYLAEVYEAFTSILTTVAKNPQKDKTLLDELQSLVKEYREKSCIDRNISVAFSVKRCPPSSRKRQPRRKQVSSDSEQENLAEERIVSKSTRKRQSRKKAIPLGSESENLEKSSSDEAFIKKKRGKKLTYISSDSEPEETVKKEFVKPKRIKENLGDGERQRSTRKRK